MAVRLTTKAQRELVELLKKIAPGVRITSGTRTVEENKRVRGAPTSLHLQGMAIDVAYDPAIERVIPQIKEEMRKKGYDIAVEIVRPGEKSQYGTGPHIHFSIRPFPRLEVAEGVPKEIVSVPETRMQLSKQARVQGIVTRLVERQLPFMPSRYKLPPLAALINEEIPFDTPPTDIEQLAPSVKERLQRYEIPTKQVQKDPIGTLRRAAEEGFLSPEFYAALKMRELGFKHLRPIHILANVPVKINGKSVTVGELLKPGRQSAKTLERWIDELHEKWKDIRRPSDALNLSPEQRKEFIKDFALLWVLGNRETGKFLMGNNPQLWEKIDNLRNRFAGMGAIAEFGAGMALGSMAAVGLIPLYEQIKREAPAAMMPEGRGIAGLLGRALGTAIAIAPGAIAGEAAIQSIARRLIQRKVASTLATVIPTPAGREAANILAERLTKVFLDTSTGRFVSGIGAGLGVASVREPTLAALTRGETLPTAHYRALADAVFFGIAGGLRAGLEQLGLRAAIAEPGWRMAHYLENRGATNIAKIVREVATRIADAVIGAPSFAAAGETARRVLGLPTQTRDVIEDAALGALFHAILGGKYRTVQEQLRAKDPARYRQLQNELRSVAEQLFKEIRVTVNLPDGRSYQTIDASRLLNRYIQEVQNRPFEEAVVLWDLLRQRGQVEVIPNLPPANSPEWRQLRGYILEGVFAFDNPFEALAWLGQILSLTTPTPTPPSAPPETPPALPETPPTPPETPPAPPAPPPTTPERPPEVRPSTVTPAPLPAAPAGVTSDRATLLNQMARQLTRAQRARERNLVDVEQQAYTIAQQIRNQLGDLTEAERAYLDSATEQYREAWRSATPEDLRQDRIPTLPTAREDIISQLEQMSRRPIPNYDESIPYRFDLRTLLPPVDRTTIQQQPPEFLNFVQTLLDNPPQPALKFAGRDIVVLNVPTVGVVAFYRSTGQNSYLPGRWFPFFGIAPNGWFIKPDSPPSGHPLYRYGDVRLRIIGDILTNLNIPSTTKEANTPDEVNQFLSQQGVAVRDVQVPPPTETPESELAPITEESPMGVKSLLPPHSPLRKPDAPSLPSLSRIDPEIADAIIADYILTHKEKPTSQQQVAEQLKEFPVLKGKISDRNMLASFIFTNWDWLQANYTQAPPAPTAAPEVQPSPETPQPITAPTVEVFETINWSERPPYTQRQKLIHDLFPEVYEEAEQENKDPEKIEPLSKLTQQNRIILEHEAVKPENVPEVIRIAQNAGLSYTAVRVIHPRFGERYHIFVYHPEDAEAAQRAIQLRTDDIAGRELSLADHVELGEAMAQDTQEFLRTILEAARERGLTDVAQEAEKLLTEKLREEAAEEIRTAFEEEALNIFREQVRSVIPEVVHDIETPGRMLEYVLVSEQGKVWKDNVTGAFIGPVIADRNELEQVMDIGLIEEALERAAEDPRFRYAYRGNVRPDGTVVGDILRPDEIPDRVPLDALYFGLRKYAEEKFKTTDIGVTPETVWSMGAKLRRRRTAVQTTPPIEAPEPEEVVTEAPTIEAPPIPEAPPTPEVPPTPEPVPEMPPARTEWREVSRKEIQVGDYIRVTYKSKVYEGRVIALDYDVWAAKTKGRFIAISGETSDGKPIAFPWTDKAKYEKLSPVEEHGIIEMEAPEHERTREAYERIEPERWPGGQYLEGGVELPETVPPPEGERAIGELRERPDREVVEHRPPDVEERRTEVVSGEHRLGVDIGGDRRRRIGYYRMTDEDIARITTPSAAQKRDDNIEAIRTLKTLIAENREPTDEELHKLIRYVSWGGLPQFLQKPEGREQLLQYLTDAELMSSIKATPNAHYTHPKIAQWLWDIVKALGFKGGKIIEPAMGVGYLIATAPDDILESSEVIGIEIEEIAARIAKVLFPKATIIIQPFENVDIPDNSVDLFISNVPFADVRIYDPRYPESPPLHDYFFIKALDKTRPGGYVVFITSMFTLDKKDETFRKMMAERGDLVAAFRLPRGAHYENALTQVVTDVLIFRKREPNKPYQGEPFIEVAPFPGTDIPVNIYFHHHPDHIFGQLTRGRGMYRPDEPIVVESPDVPVEERMKQAIEFVRQKINSLGKTPEPEEVFQPEGAPETVRPPETPPAPTEPEPEIPRPMTKEEFLRQSLRNGSYYIDSEGKVRQVGVEEPIDIGVTPQTRQRNLEAYKRLIALRDQLKWVIHLMYIGASDDVLKPEQAELNRLYDDFVAKFGRIRLQGSLAKRLMVDDPDFPLLEALEILDPDEPTNPEKIQKADIFTKRTISPFTPEPQTLPDDIADALAITLNLRGFPDFEWMAEKTGKSVEELQEQLWERGLVFLNPENGKWEIREKYLSGFVGRKLDIARRAAERDPRFMRNVRALEALDVPYIYIDQIDIPPGAPFVPPFLIKAFIDMEIFGEVIYKGSVVYDAETSTWGVWLPSWAAARGTEWTSRLRDLDEFIADTLNGRRIVVKRQNKVDTEATAFIQSQQDAFWRRFVSWVKEIGRLSLEDWLRTPHKGYFTRDYLTQVWQSVRKLEEDYNIRYGGWVPPKYDGSHLTFPGMNPEIQLYPHQRDAIWRIIVERRLILAHEVGTGKTFTMIAAAMKMKQLGIIKKPMFVVPNPIIESWRNEFARLYPGARVLFITPDKFDTPQKRQQAFAQMATGDYDAIVIAESTFNLISPSLNSIKREIQEQLKAIDAAEEQVIRQVGMFEEREKITQERIKDIVKQFERMRMTLQRRLAEAQKRLERTASQNILTFDQLGVDFLFIDEAHHFKNYPFVTKHYRLAGLSQANSKRAFELMVKINDIEKVTGERRVVFASGTPISNTTAEIHHMIRFIAPDLLRAAKLQHFDAFIASFGSIEDVVESEIHGLGVRTRRRIEHLINVPELARLFHSIADSKLTIDMPYIKLPKVNRRIIPVKPTEFQVTYMEQLAERAANVARVDPKEDNYLKITHEARQVSLDPRLLSPNYPAGEKVARAVEEIWRIYNETKDRRLTQIVFADRYQSPDHQFNLFETMIDMLAAKGVPREEMVNMVLVSDDKRREVFKQINEGKIRIVFGTTDKLGEGVNIQRKLVALHHLDPTWKPAWLLQREGRIVRQGNENEEVFIYYYATEAPSIDTYMYHLNNIKAQFIMQIMRGIPAERVLEDPTSEHILTYQEIAAITSGDPRLQRFFELQRDVSRLAAEKSGFEQMIARLKQEHTVTQQRLHGLKRLLNVVSANRERFENARNAGRVFVIDGIPYKGIQEVTRRFGSIPTEEFIKRVKSIAVYDIPVSVEKITAREYRINFLDTWTTTSAQTLDGFMRRLEEVVRREFEIETEKARLAEISSLEEHLRRLEENLKRKWEKEDEYQSKLAELTRLKVEISGTRAHQVVYEEGPAAEEEPREVEGDDTDWDDPPTPGWGSRRRGAVINPFAEIAKWWRRWRKKFNKDDTLIAARDFLREHVEWRTEEAKRTWRLISAPHEPLSIWEKAFTTFVDYLYPIEKAVSAVKRYRALLNMPLPLEQDPRMFLDDYHASAAQARSYLVNEVFPILTKVKSHGEFANFLAYLIALHAKELNAAGIRSGIDDAQIAKIIEEIETHWENKGIADEMDTAIMAWVQVNNRLLGMLADEGIISEDVARESISRWQFYIPFRRVVETLGQVFGLEGAHLDVAGQNIVLPIRGSSRKILNPLEVFARKVYLTFHIINRNRPVRLFFEAIEDLKAALRERLEKGEITEDDPAWLFVQQFRRIRPIVKTRERLTEATEEVLVGSSKPEEEDEEELMELEVPVLAREKIIRFPRERMETVHFMRNGGVVAYEVPRDIAEAFKGPKPVPETLTLLFGWLSRLIRLGGTDLRPTWWFRNMFRDIMYAFHTLPPEVSKTTFPAFLWQVVVFTLRRLARRPDVVEIERKFYETGAHLYTFYAEFSGEMREWRDTLAKMELLDKPIIVRIIEKLGRVVLSPLATMESFGQALETNTRIFIYQQALKAGFTEEQARYLARHATINFRRMGLIGPWITLFLPFTNARIQAIRNLYRSGFFQMRPAGVQPPQPPQPPTPPEGAEPTPPLPPEPFYPRSYAFLWFMFKALQLFLLGLAIYFFFNRRRKGFWQLPPWAFSYDVPIFIDDDRYIRLPFDDFQRLFVVSGMILGMVLDGNGYDNALTSTAAESLLQSFLPFNINLKPPYIGEDIIPAPLRGLIEWSFNRELFTGREIVPQWMEELPPELRYTRRTIPLFKWLGRIVHASPEMLQTVAETHFPAITQLAFNPPEVAEAARRWFEGLPPEPRTTFVRQIPILGGFIGRATETLPASVEEQAEIIVSQMVEAFRQGYPLVVERYRVRAGLPQIITERDFRRLELMKERDPQKYDAAVSYFIAKTIQDIWDIARTETDPVVRRERLQEKANELRHWLTEKGWMREGRLTPAGSRALVNLFVSVAQPLFRTVVHAPQEQKWARLRALYRYAPELFPLIFRLGTIPRIGQPRSMVEALRQWAERYPEEVKEALNLLTQKQQERVTTP